MKYLASFFIALFILTSCSDSAKKQELQQGGAMIIDTSPQWAQNAVLYELNVRQFSNSGTLNAATEQLPRLKELGVDIIWLMPIYPIGEVERKGSMGSYYAISNYTAINPDMGTPDDLKNFVNQAHKLGMKVILDWVANHTAHDHPWITDNPEWYAFNDMGEMISPADWTDVRKLNYDNQELRKEMIADMKYWVINYDIDGFRADVAGSVPTSFWEEAMTSLDSIKPLFMLAEDEHDSTLIKKAFDANYGWHFHHLMNEVAKGKRNAHDIYNYIRNKSIQLETESVHALDKHFSMLFTSNHDENSWNGTEFERLGQGVEAFAVLTYTLPGIPLIYNGQEVGLNRRLAFFEKDSINWSKNSKYTNFYKTLNSIKHNNPALANGINGGILEFINTNHPDEILAFKRVKGDNTVVTIVNLSDKNLNVRLKLKGDYNDLFSNVKIMIDHSLYMPAWSYYILN